MQGRGEIDIRRFDPSTMKPHRISVCIGKRGTGKSTLLKDIMSTMQHTHYGVAMSPTNESVVSFRTYMPSSSVYTDYRVDVVERMLASQREKSHDGQGDIRSLFLALDDCMYDKALIKGKAIRDLFMNGRHYRISFIMAVQYLMDLPPALRTQVDYCFALRENVIANRERLYKFFFGIFPSYADFARVLDACTEDYECIVIDNTVQSNNISDCVFWYKAEPEQPPFRLCAQVFWDLDSRLHGQQGAAQAEQQPQEGGTRTVCRVVKRLPGL